ncbi:helix-turn-helix domain-containing protein [Brevundimonas naejangsanensis]|uniref:helix-turn-helix domain-containing protein n=1 Tax=Brevundimonas naejangsanensis TaxID=588932 RepID=UPI0026EB38CB|nr:helix-turn-helix transcriptional regulator [Brevundimonas naejangsanensis]
MSLIALLGRNIRRRRHALGISQEELAFRAEMKRSYVSGIELGNRKPSIDALERLAGALHVDPRTLLEPDRHTK